MFYLFFTELIEYPRELDLFFCRRSKVMLVNSFNIWGRDAKYGKGYNIAYWHII